MSATILDFGISRATPAMGPLPQNEQSNISDGCACVAPLRLDGGTKAMRAFDLEAAHPELAKMLEECQRPRTREESRREREQGGRIVRIPTPQLSPLQEIYGKATVGGERRQHIRIEVPDVVHLTFDVEEGTVRVEGKAKALWSWGWHALATAWLSAMSWVVGDGEHTLAQAKAHGWRVTGIELASDFAGLRFNYEDAWNFILPANMKQGSRGKVDLDVEPIGKHGHAETINIGRRGGNVSWCIYWKTRQIEQKKGGDPSTYRTAWKAGGWNGTDEVTRVEVRFARHGLVWYDDETGEYGPDLRDPAALTDENLRRVWASATREYRLAVPRESRRKNWETDARWADVQRVARMPPLALVQDRSAQVDTHAEAVRGVAWARPHRRRRLRRPRPGVARAPARRIRNDG
jgi:hypothetical protein